jgi:hypothetical protein
MAVRATSSFFILLSFWAALRGLGLTIAEIIPAQFVPETVKIGAGTYDQALQAKFVGKGANVFGLQA